LYFSRWSIRRKLLVCLAIVLSLVAALAYSGFAGAYSYRELARSIGVRATDLKLAGELTEGLGELRVSLSQTRQLSDLSIVNQLSGVHQVTLGREFQDKLARIETQLQRYRKHLDTATLSDIRFGDRVQERHTLAGLEAALARLKRTQGDARFVFDVDQAGLLWPEVDQMYAQASDLQARMHRVPRLDLHRMDRHRPGRGLPADCHLVVLRLDLSAVERADRRVAADRAAGRL
jgi:hypothetical protein